MRTIYKTYEWKGDKDPAIYIAKTCIQLYAIKHNMRFSAAVRDICENVGCSPRTLWCWFSGPTRTPKVETFVAVVNATGEKVVAAGHRLSGDYRPPARLKLVA